MLPIISKKAGEVIKSFNEREKSIYDLGVEYLQADMQHIINCSKEIPLTDDRPKYETAIKHQTNMAFRVKYIVQCLGIRLTDNYETGRIEVTANKE